MLEWLSEANTIVYAVSSLVVVQELGSGAQKHLIGHTAPVVALSAAQTNKFVASAQEGALAVVRIWDRVAALPLAILHHHHSDMQQARDAPPRRRSPLTLASPARRPPRPSPAGAPVGRRLSPRRPRQGRPRPPAPRRVGRTWRLGPHARRHADRLSRLPAPHQAPRLRAARGEPGEDAARGGGGGAPRQRRRRAPARHGGLREHSVLAAAAGEAARVRHGAAAPRGRDVPRPRDRRRHLGRRRPAGEGPPPYARLVIVGKSLPGRHLVA